VGEHDRAVGRLLLGLPGPGQSVVERRSLAALQRLLYEDVDATLDWLVAPFGFNEQVEQSFLLAL